MIGDKAYNDYHTTTMISKIFSKKPPESTFDRCDAKTQRERNSTREEPAYVEFIQHTYRKQIETTGSDFERQLPSSIHAVTPEGFELKVFLFVLAVSFGALV